MFSRVFTLIRSILYTITQTMRRAPRTTALTLALLIALGYFSGVFGKQAAEAPTEEAVQTPEVHIASLGALQSEGSTAVLLGEVRSVSQAELRAQKSGEITKVNVRAGQVVPAGMVLAEIENAGERAAVLQAQGALQAAQAGLARVRNGARAEDRASASAGTTNAGVSLAQAKESARTAYTTAYAASQDAILAKADTFFDDPYTVRPKFRVNAASYDERLAIEQERVKIHTLLETWKADVARTPSDTSLDTSLATTQQRLDTIRRFLDRIAYFVSKQEITEDRTSATIATQNALLLGARQGIDGARAQVTGARSGLAAATAASTVASLSENKITTGERIEDVQAAEAGVTQARGILAGATAVLENSLIRSPIAGTVTSFSIARGDFVSPNQAVAVVANEGAREIVAFVSEDVRATIAPGMKVLVDGTYEGIITSADPGLDPVTKRSRVTVGVSKESTLTNGSFVEVAIQEETKNTSTQKPTQKGWYIPITAIKVLPTGLAVFTVTERKTLEAIKISEGTIIGDRMLIQDPLSSELRIVRDVRGRIEGETITIAE
jgi:multidrug resistance efflux pump